MRVRSLVVCLALTGCITNPDPREPKGLEQIQRQGYGGWIEVELRDNRVVRGELLAVEGNTLFVLDLAHKISRVQLSEVTGAALYTYHSEGGFGVWGLLGTLSTASHGFLLALSAPVWMISAGIAAGVESRHVRLRYPQDGIESFSAWARFPQGMPVPKAPSKLDQAWELTKQAQDAARAGDCERVAVLDPQIRALHLSFYEHVFLRDAAIRRCFGLPVDAPPGATPPAAPTPSIPPAPPTPAASTPASSPPSPPGATPPAAPPPSIPSPSSPSQPADAGVPPPP